MLEQETKPWATIVAIMVILSTFGAMVFLVAYGVFRGPMTNPDTKYLHEYKKMVIEELKTNEVWDGISADEKE